MTRIEPYLPPQDEPSASARRVDAANQRDNWLRQMELAQMGQMGAAPAPAAPAQRPAMTPLAQAPMRAALHPAGHQDTAGTSDAPRDADAEAAPDAGVDHDEKPVQADDAARMTDDDGATAGVAANAAAAAAALAATQPTPIGAGPGYAAEPAGGIAGAAAGPALPMAQDALRGAADGVLPPAAQPQAVGLAAALRAAQATPAESAASAEALDPPAPGADGASEAPDWQKRMMHLTGDGDDVQLWIRDGELSPAQSQQLVARLAADVAAMGLRLKEATVNGKPALRAAVRHAGAIETDADEADGAAIPEPITHPTTER